MTQHEASPRRVGPYEIIEPIGRGGMGVVYRARDTRLGRDVALKLVHASGDEGGGHRDRLLAETRAASRLNHPNVMAVLDVGVDDGRPYMVSELIDGASLRVLLDRGRLPRRRVLDLATQVASGLAAAHAAGLVHRDLKPDNVMVTSQWVAKIVDFGLAKSLAPVDGQGSIGQTLTAPHMVLGTVQYMSPEQARGAAVDPRSDQFSFGAMLYEMLCGRRAFARDSTVETLAAILKDEPPPLDTLDPPVPPPLQWVLDRCLAKSPDDRYGSTLDLWHDLRALSSRLERTFVSPAPPLPRWRRALAVATAVSLLALGWLGATRFRAEDALSPPTWQRLTFEQGFVDAARFSGDGQMVIYSAAWDNGPFRTFSTTLTSPESRALDLPSASVLAVSPSGELAISTACEHVAFSGVCAGTLARVPMLGGAPRAIAADVRTADWAPDGSLAVTRLLGDALSVEYPIGTRLSARGSAYVRVSPDGSKVAWTEAVDVNLSSVMVRDRSGTRALAGTWRGISGLAWSREGDAVFVSGYSDEVADDAVLRLGLDGSSRTVLRGPARVRVLDAGTGGRLLVSVTSSARLLKVWEADPATRARDFSWLGNAAVDAISADGRRVLFTVRTGAAIEFTRPSQLYPLYTRSLDGGPATRIGTGYGVALSNDGLWALSRTRPERGMADLVLVPLGPGEARVLPRGDVDIGSANSRVDFSGRDRLVMRARSVGGAWRTFVQRLDGSLPVPVAHEPGEIVSPLAPDGTRFVARRSDGTLWLNHVDAPRGAPRRLLLDPPATALQWTEDGGGLILARQNGINARISRLNLATGHETVVRDIAAVSEAGVQELRGLTASRGGVRIAATEIRVMGALYLVEGVQ